MPLTREQIRAAARKKLRVQDVTLEDYGGEVRLRQLTAGELADFQSFAVVCDNEGRQMDAVYSVVQRSAIDDKGEPLWPEDGGLEDIKALPPKDLEALAAAAMTLNGVSPELIEEAAKN